MPKVNLFIDDEFALSMNFNEEEDGFFLSDFYEIIKSDPKVMCITENRHFVELRDEWDGNKFNRIADIPLSENISKDIGVEMFAYLLNNRVVWIQSLQINEQNEGLIAALSSDPKFEFEE